MEGRKTPGEERQIRGKRIIGRKHKCLNYVFYKKPMASKLGTLKISAVTENSKVATASAEFQRRWRNCSVWTGRQEIVEIKENTQTVC